MNYSTLEPMSYSTPLKNYSNHEEEWQGQRSRRFAKSIRIEPRRDLIKSSSLFLTQILIFQTRHPSLDEFTLMNPRVYKNLFDRQSIRYLQYSTGTRVRAR